MQPMRLPRLFQQACSSHIKPLRWPPFLMSSPYLYFELHVATTIGKGIVDPGIVDHYVIFGALVGAIAWNVITWYYGIPSSSSHALIGGLVGAAIAKAGAGSLIVFGLFKIISFIIIAPLLGFLFGSLMVLLVSWLFVRSLPRNVDKWFRRIQLFSSSMYSLGHGGNDAQKTMGIIWMLMIAGGYSGASDSMPMWVVSELLCRHWPWHAFRRMAHRENDGAAHHQDQASRGRLRRIGRCA